jgi:hypothetical protein
MSQDNININVTENIDQVNIVASEIVEVVDLNLYATTEDVSINVTEEIIQVNVNKVTATEQIQSDWNQTNTDALDFIKNKPTIPEAITNTSELINDGADGVNPFITLEDIPAPITIDAVPTDGSSNAVSSNGVFDALATKQNTIGFTPENVANKATNLTSPDNTKYPTTQAVVDGLATKQNVITNPVTGTGANGQVAFWNGTNSQTGDNGLFWDNTNKRLGIGTNTPLGSISVKGAYAAANVAPLIVQNTTPYGGLANQYSQVWLDSSGVMMAYIRNDSTFQITQNVQASYFVSGQAGSQSTAIFRGPNNTGIFFPSSNSLAVTTSNTERMRITNTGEVTIGATTAGARLDVRAQGALSTDIAFRVRNSADNRDLFSVNGAYCTTRSRFVTTNTTDTSVIPMIDLLRAGFGETAGAIIGQINFRGGFPASPESRTTNGYAGINAISEGNWYSGALTFTTNPNDATLPTEQRVERMRITSGGNILINTTTNAGFRLDVNGTARVQSSFRCDGQVTFTSALIGTTIRLGSNPQAASSILDVQSTTQGFLPPRMTNAQRLAIASPAIGLMVYCTDVVEGLYVNKSTGWTFII